MLHQCIEDSLGLDVGVDAITLWELANIGAHLRTYHLYVACFLSFLFALGQIAVDIKLALVL